jgi:hypothetical protein
MARLAFGYRLRMVISAGYIYTPERMLGWPGTATSLVHDWHNRKFSEARAQQSGKRPELPARVETGTTNLAAAITAGARAIAPTVIDRS